MKNRTEILPSSFAERYETVLAPVIFQPWARELIRRVKPRETDRVLDLACGTGVVTREIAKLDTAPRSLTGMDFNADMLGVARTRAKELGIEAEWIEGNAGQLPFPNDNFDRAFCQQALQFFPDRHGALKELRRVLTPGSQVAFCVSTEISSNPLLQSQALALEKHVGNEAGEAVRAICSFSDADEIRALFEDADYCDIMIEKVSLTLYHPDGKAFAAGALSGMHTGDKLSTISRETQQQCINDFLTGLGDYYDGTKLRFPHVSNVITAKA